MNDSDHNHSDESKLSDFEANLSAVPRKHLEPDLRDLILNRACGVESATVNSVQFRWWQSMPKPMIWSLAACWTTSLCLYLTTPDTSSVATKPVLASADRDETKIEDQRALLVAWVERGRSLEQVEKSFEIQ